MKRLLDLFCGAGGAAVGYHRAGFEVVGVDIKPQKHYPFEFHQADALEYLAEHGREFDAIHASPPCQAFTTLARMWNAKKHESLVEPTREALVASGRPFVIENVVGAPLVAPVLLCGTMFGLGTERAQLRRHRLFETSFPVGLTPTHQHVGRVIGVYGNKSRDRRRANGGSKDFPNEDAKMAMGIDWMTRAELSQAIPPAYTEWIGKQLIRALCDVSVASTPSA
jgi:DNA (cytosine-5)-methyltransferase 1